MIKTILHKWTFNQYSNNVEILNIKIKITIIFLTNENEPYTNATMSRQNWPKTWALKHAGTIGVDLVCTCDKEL